MWGLVMGFLLMATGGGPRGGVCRRGLWLAGVGGGLRVVRLCLRGGGGAGGGLVWGWHCWWWGGRGLMVCWAGVSASRGVLWVLRVRAVRFLRLLAGRGVEVRVGGGCLGIRVGLWSIGSGWLLLDGACWHQVRVEGLLVVVGCFL